MFRSSAIVVSLLLSGCASIKSSGSDQVAQTQAPFEASIQILGHVSVAAGTPLQVSTVNGQPAFCSTKPLYHSLGDNRGMCFYDTGNTGFLDKFYIMGTARFVTYDAHIPYAMVGKPPTYTVTNAPLDPEYLRIQRQRDSSASQQASMEREARYAAEERAVAADRTICAYETHNAGNVGYQPNLLSFVVANVGAAAEQQNVMNLCMQARAAARN